MRSLLAYALLFLLFAVATLLIALQSDVSGSDRGYASGRGVFLSTAAPDLTPDELSLLDGVLCVDSLAELEASITDETPVVIVDASTLAALPEGYLDARASEGRAILGINVFANDLATAAGFPSGGWPTPEEWAKTHDGHGEGAFYSYMYRSKPDAETRYTGGGQHHFKDRLFSAVLGQLLEGNWRD